MATGRRSRLPVTRSFSQYEPLTKRLHNLLKDYKEGFSVPKELIQNADDAGARRVCFLYDCRDNLDARSNLVEEGLAEFQGPALWAFNDAQFTEHDFENIRKLGGATKEEDTTKVGKFGLGFNSVYNITDIPSFISGNRAVIFDPHSVYLGESGRSTDLKEETDAQIVERWKNQLKPFDGIFGCNLRSSDTVCSGTLFRYPLRTEQQAQRSEIKNLHYTDPQMRKFIKVFAKHSGNLLIFTQNVKCVTFFHLPKEGKPKDVTMIVDVRKTTTLDKQLVFSDSRQILAPSNILKYSSDALHTENEHEDLCYIDEQIEIEQCFSSHAFNKVCNIQSSTSKLNWRLTWSIGCTEAKMYATESSLKGLVPLAAVAIPLTNVPQRHPAFVHLSDCGKGFYEQGHLFCFMPLPIETSFMVHINATFALTSDRRHLCVKSSDNTDNSESEWNRILMTRVVTQAWVYGLHNLGCTSENDEKIYYSLWPTKDQLTVVDGFLDSFYQFIVNENVKVFWGVGGQGCSFKEMLILDPQLRHDQKVGDIAFFVFKQSMRDANLMIVDLPRHILDSFISCKINLGGRICTEQDFFEKYVFPSILSTFLSYHDRNALTKYALLSKSSSLRQLVQSHTCIPTIPNGTLRNTTDVVHPSRLAASLYLKEENVFPEADFRGHDELSVLESLGMKCDEISSEQILERATFIQNKQNPLITRSLLKYLNKDSSLNTTCKRYKSHGKIQQRLQNADIFPVLPKPNGWPFHWKGKKGLSSAVSMYDTNVINLVGCSEKILDIEMLGIQPGSEILSWLGVRDKHDVDIQTVVDQLKRLYSERSGHTKKKMKLTEICTIVYKYLEKKCLMRDCQYILASLKSDPCILTQYGFIEPQKMAMNLLVPLRPYLYQVEEHFHQFYPNLLKAFGIKDYFTTEEICNVQREITRTQHGRPLEGKVLACFCKVVQVLVDAMVRNNEHITEIQLPSVDGHLHQASNLCLNDCEWLPEQRHMRFLHPNITPKDGQALGAKTKREASLQSHMTSIQYATGFGQSEELTKRLSRILQVYPKDVSILNELLQNADDAGATELMFIKDFNNYRSDKVFGEEWKHLQGPALCVFNNSYFRDEDFQGIQNLGEGSKSNDPLKTGQYGVGFNVVYHLTDVPSWITVGPRIEKTLCVLDPHQKYIPRTGQTGIQFKHLQDLRQMYKDVFSCYHEDKVLNRPTGTLFRFPLRTSIMADESRISQHETTTKEIEDMLVTFKTEAWTSMLFLSNVRKITIASITSKGKLAVEYRVETALSRDDEKQMDKYVARLKTLFPNPNLQNIDSEQVIVVKTIKDSNNTEKWLIVQQVGFMSSQPISEDILHYWRCGEIHLLPRGGVALSLSPSACNGKLFCVLPLPGKTGLPVHINGHFALGHEARRDLWHGTNDYRVQWNNHVIQAIICPSYIAALKYFQSYSPTSCQRGELNKWIGDYYRQFPRNDKASDQYMHHLVKSFYTEVGSQSDSIFPVILPSNGKFHEQQETGGEKMSATWVPVICASESRLCGYFNTLNSFFPDLKPSAFNRTMTNNQSDSVSKADKQRRQLERLLKDLGMKLVEPSSGIERQFDVTRFKDDIHCSTPEDVAQFLKTNVEHDDGGCCIGSVPEEIQYTHMKSLKNVKRITKFCKKIENFEGSLLGLPLKVTQSNLLTRFSETDVIFVTNFGYLLPSSSDRLLHKDLVSLYGKCDLQKTKCMKQMTIEEFAILLKDDVDSSFYQPGQPVVFQLNDKKQRWICDLWTFLSHEIKDQQEQKWSEVENRSELPGEEKRRMMNEFRNNALQPLQNWSLLPANVDPDHIGTISLYPLKQREEIIYMDHHTGSLFYRDNQFENVLKKLPVPKLTKSVFFHSESNKLFYDGMVLCENLVASLKNPRRMLAALANLTINDTNCSQDECCIVLEYFAREFDSLEKSLLRKLKQLPFYPSLSGQCVSLEKWCQVNGVTDRYPHIPTDGLRDLFASLGEMFIKNDVRYKRILEHLRLKKCTRERMYAFVIVPNLMQLSPDARKKHLLHIRDQIFGPNYHSNEESTELIERLKETPFIPTSDGKQRCASDFYSSRKPEFKLLCPPSAFLPKPYDKDEWQDLLTELGLKYQLSVEDFVNIASDLEEMSGQGITSEVKQKSKLLTELLQKRENVREEEIWKRIRNTRFVLPFDITAEGSHGRDLDNIHPQFENAEKLVAYSDCCDPIHCDTVWTSCSMWTNDAHPTMLMNPQDSVEVLNQLGVAQEPSLEHCIVHLQNISKALRQKDAFFRKQHQTLLQKIFTDMYDNLQKYMPNSAIKEMAFAFPVVFIVETCEVVPAAEVVIELGASENIPGYIFRAPTCFGRYFQLFEYFGAQKTVSSKTYATVLHRLYRMTKGTKLNVNELKIVERVVMNLVRCLSKKKAIVDIGKLYLPNEDCMLKNSSSLVLKDSDDLAIRMESKHLDYFLGCDSVGFLLAKLPEEQRLVPLSSLVTETLASKCSEHVSSCGEARVYEQRIKSSDFINGILRLCNYLSKKLSTNKCSEIEKRISQVSINQVEDLETVLILEGDEIEGSGKKKSCHILMNTEHEAVSSDGFCQIYISSVHSQEDTITQIALAINALVKDHLGKYTILVEKMLLMEPERIHSYLDKYEIRKYTKTNKKSSTVYPKVGTRIPEESRDKLSNTFSTFSVGEYVGFCKNEADAAKGDLPVYVYAIINEVENDSSPSTARYRLEVKDDVTKSVSATRMFKLYR